MKKFLFLCMAMMLIFTSCIHEDYEGCINNAEMVSAQFQQYFFEEDGTPKIIQLEGGEDGIWYANVADGKRVIELFNFITGLNVKENSNYEYKFQSCDRMVILNLKGTIVQDDDAIFGEMDVVIPKHPEIRKILFVHKDFFNGTNADTVIPVVI